MRDTSHLEHIAEDYISSKLQEAGFLVAKPKFDRDGTDLIILLSVNTGAKFGRVQSKGRSLEKSVHSNISIARKYVVEPFFLLVYVKYKPNSNLYVFFTEEIKEWNILNDNYVFYISRNSIDRSSLDKYLFGKDKISKIKKIVERTTSDQEKKMFNLIKRGQDIIEKQKKIRDVEGLLSKIKLSEKDLVIAEKKLENLFAELNKIAEQLIKSTSLSTLNLIEKYKNEGFSEKSVLTKLELNNDIELSRKKLWLIILYKYNTIKEKF